MSTRSDRFLINYSINFFSSITIIFIGKWLFRYYPISGFTLTIFNCFVSGILSTITLKLSVNPNRSKTSTIRSRLLMAAAFAGYLLFSNLSLQYNTLATYQIFKLQVPLVLMLFELVQTIFGCNQTLINDEKLLRDYPILIVFSLLLVLFGSILSFVGDVYLNVFGFSFGFISVFFNALYQNFVQVESAPTIHDRTRFIQIISFLSVGFLAPIWPFVDATFEFHGYLFQRWKPLLSLIVCGLAAFLLNSSSVWCIKDDETIRFNIVGQIKTAIVVFLGSITFAEKIYVNQIVGISFIAFGFSIYACLNCTKKNSDRDCEQQLT